MKKPKPDILEELRIASAVILQATIAARQHYRALDAATATAKFIHTERRLFHCSDRMKRVLTDLDDARMRCEHEIAARETELKGTRPPPGPLIHPEFL